MSSRHLLLLCIVSALQEPKVVNGINVFAGTEGRSGGMSCYLPLSGNRKFKYFCKDSCEGSNILLKTDGVMATNGAYSLRYEIGTGSHSGRGILHVSITNLTMADSGRYICALGSAQVALSELQFEVIITDVLPRTDNLLIQAASEGGNVTIPCHGTNFTRGSKRFFCRNKCEKEEDVLIETEEAKAARGRHSIEYREMSTFGFYITITDLNTSDQGWYACGYGSALSPDWVAFIPVVVIAAPVKTTPSWTTFPTSSPSTSTPRPTTTTTHILTSERFATFPATTPPTTATVTATPTWTTFPTSSPSPSTPMPTTTTHILTSERFATFPATTPPTTAPVTATPTWTTFPTSSPSPSTPMPTTTTHILTSERFATFPATTPPTTAPVTATPTWTTFPTSSPSPSTPMPTTTHILTSERFATFPATTPPTTAPVTTTPTWTTFPTSSPSTSTPMPTTTHILPSERFAPFPATTPPTTGRPLLPLMCLPALGVLLPAVGLVLLNRWKKDRNSRQTTNMSDTEMSAVYNKHISVPVCDSTRD